MRHVLLLALALSVPATAAQRRVYPSSFERIRVEGPFQVTVATGRSPGGSVTGDARAIERVEVRQDGNILVVRAAPVEATAARETGGAAVTVALATPGLIGATMLGGGVLTITGGRAPRLDVAVTGPGSIGWTGADAEQLTATVVGTGTVTLGGRAGKARLLVNGAGHIAADTLDTGDLFVHVDGPGEVGARARYTAAVTNNGLGQVTVAGTPKCTVRSGAGPVTCGAGRASN